MNQKNNETKVVDIQLLGSILSIISFAITFILLYNQKLLKQNKKPLFSKKDTLNYVALNILFVLAIVFIFLSANGIQLNIDRKKGEDLIYDYIDIFSNILTLIVSLLAIYTAFKAIENNDLSIDELEDIALE